MMLHYLSTWWTCWLMLCSFMISWWNSGFWNIICGTSPFLGVIVATLLLLIENDWISECQKRFFIKSYFHFTKLFQYFDQINWSYAFPPEHIYKIIRNCGWDWSYFVKYKQKCECANNFLVDCINMIIPYKKIL